MWFLGSVLDIWRGVCVQAPGAEDEAAADANGHAEEDTAQLGPRPENLMPRTGGVAAAADNAADDIYRPPKLNPAAMQVGIAILHSLHASLNHGRKSCCAHALLINLEKNQRKRDWRCLKWPTRVEQYCDVTL